MKDVINMVDVASQYQKSKLKGVLKSYGFSSEISSLLMTVSDLGNLFREADGKLGANAMRMKYYKENLKFVEPLAHELGPDENGKIRYARYVPILDSLKGILQHDDVMAAVMHLENTLPNVLRDFKDGLYLSRTSCTKKIPMLSKFSSILMNSKLPIHWDMPKNITSCVVSIIPSVT